MCILVPLSSAALRLQRESPAPLFFQAEKAELKRQLLENNLKRQQKAELKRQLRATLKKLAEARQPKKKTRWTASGRSRRNLDAFVNEMSGDDRAAEHLHGPFFVRFFLHSLVRSLVCSFARSLARSLLQSFIRSFTCRLAWTLCRRKGCRTADQEAQVPCSARTVPRGREAMVMPPLRPIAPQSPPRPSPLRLGYEFAGAGGRRTRKRCRVKRR